MWSIDKCYRGTNQIVRKCHFTLSLVYCKAEQNVLSELTGGSLHTRLLDSQSNNFMTLIYDNNFPDSGKPCKREAGEPYCYCRLVMFRRLPHSSKGCWNLFSAFCRQKKDKIYEIQAKNTKIYHLKSHLLLSLGQIIFINLKWSASVIAVFWMSSMKINTKP